MKGINRVFIMGIVGAEPRVREFKNGGSVTNISVATSDTWKDKKTGEKKEATEWHQISLYGRLSEIAQQYVQKGSMVAVDASLHTRKYQDDSGKDRYITEIRASNIHLMGGAGSNANRSKTQDDAQATTKVQASNNEQAQDYSVTEDDIPL